MEKIICYNRKLHRNGAAGSGFFGRGRAAVVVVDRNGGFLNLGLNRAESVAYAKGVCVALRHFGLIDSGVWAAVGFRAPARIFAAGVLGVDLNGKRVVLKK